MARDGASAALAVRGARTPARARRDTPRNAISPAIPSTSTRSPTDIGGPMDDAMTFFKIAEDANCSARPEERSAKERARDGRDRAPRVCLPSDAAHAYIA